MNRTEELRQQLIGQLESAIRDFEKYGDDEFGADSVHIDIITARRTVELLKKLFVPIEGVWQYYTNDEGKARWRCSVCGKIAHKNPMEKQFCSSCSAKMRMEA
jgi:ABC-type ATPase with predicted acetyltransferase domain